MTPRDAAELPEPSFRVLVMQLLTQALIELGEIPNPMTGSTGKSILRARFTIDLLVMLREKTQGNLEPEEEQELDAILRDLMGRLAHLGRA